ncbi:Transcriptional activator protein acu-15 [Talaromyces islandicus]|uniref:Transcriptional activator protein acu-15 n=1 Tax=Talaromyces islandicus TaxID=28573 RepID=A0A0U1MAV5_TALIS|nr:Transcriptional activator protein acu-15 [Talaromyces islandicus]
MPIPKRRMPISCEPCRGRKIRCLRAKDSAGCCETCIRRGIPRSQCVFLGYHHHYLQPAGERQGEDPTNGELLARIRDLENIVRGQATNSPSPPIPGGHNGLTPSTQASSGRGPGSNGYKSETEEATMPAQLTPPMHESSRPQHVSYGTLSMSDRGHVQFNPHGSQWSSVLKGDSTTVASVANFEYDDDESAADFPFNLASCTKPEDLLAALPPVRQCDALKEAYFDVFAPLFHILHNPTFHKDYISFQKEPESAPLSWLALLYVILSISVTALDDNDPILHDLGRKKTSGDNVSVLMLRYRNAAMQCLSADRYLFRHNMYTIQALVLLIYGINHTHGKTWALLGTAYNIATALGCHIDPAHFTSLTVVQCEERRRCWAGLMMLYTIQNISMGNFEQRHITSDVQLPANINDEDLIDPGAMESSHSISSMSVDTPTQMSYVLFKFRLYHLCSKVCNQIFGPTPPMYSAIMECDTEIAAEQDSWTDRYLAESQNGQMLTYHHVHLNILYGYSHQMSLLLHRPVLLNRSSAGYTDDEVKRSRAQCLKSASGLLGLQQMFHETAYFQPYRWYSLGLGSFYSFHAAVILVTLLPEVKDEVEYMELRRLLEVSLSIFEQMSNRSRMCAKAAPILRHLLLPAPALSFSSSSTESLRPDAPSMPIPGYSTQMEVLMNQLQPQQWLSQPSMSWDGWDLLFTDRGVPQPENVTHVAFARQFGELDDVKPYVKAGLANRLKHDELFDVSSVEMDGSLLDPDSPRGQANKGNGLFHVDSSFNPCRAGYSLLLAHELPPPEAGTGGQTAFADTRTAFDELPADLRQSLLNNDYVAAHSIHHSRKLAAPDFFANLNPLDHPMGRHKLVQRHEASDRMNLYLAAHIHHIEGLSETDSTELVQNLLTHATQDKYVIEVQWQNPGDLVIWDNTCTMHRAVGGPFLRTYRRDMRRATVHDKSSYAWGLNEHTDERQGLP